MPDIPSACQDLSDQVEFLRQEIALLQNDIRGPGTTDRIKRAALREIARMQAKLRTGEHELSLCIQQPGQERPSLQPLPLRAKFEGTYTLRTSDSKAPGPFVGSGALELYFDDKRTAVTILRFTPIVTRPFSTPMGDNTTTVTLTRGGSGDFNLVTGAVRIPVGLYFDQSIDLPFYTEDSDLDLELSTGLARSRLGDVTGAPLDAAGHITLVGAAQFRDGYLNKKDCTLVISGAVAPHP
jgi:hypothetical protein